MELRALGQSGLQVSKLALGTMSWGRDTDIYEARDLFNIFYEAGGRLIDTADVYSEGVSEEIVGEFIREHPDVLVATKAVSVRATRSRNASRSNLLQSLDTSLKRLNRNHIDIWHMHAWDSQTPIQETLQALETAVSSGRVRYVGVSNYAGWQLAQAAGIQQLTRSVAPLISAQMEYSLLERGIEREVLPAANTFGIGIMAWSPLGRGVLTGKYRNNTPADSRAASKHFAGFVAPYLTERPGTIVDAVCMAAQALGHTPLDVALAWVLDRPQVACAVIGARTATQLRAIINGLDAQIPPEIFAALDDVSKPALGYPEFGWNQT
jgi:aryl-alcohol dehydrogenase-like predicted oxidoreductase